MTRFGFFKMIFKELNNGKCKTYLIACTDTKKAIIIDPLQQRIDRYLAVLAYFQLTLEFVIDTHTHADHRSAVAELKSITDCQIARNIRAPQPNVDVHLEDGDEMNIGEIPGKILYTPGHTPDSISLYFQDRVLTGDCLLIGGTGRTDFAAGDAGQQYDSITQKLFSLPDETVVYPAHDYRGNTQSTIGHEKLHNPRLVGRNREQYAELMENLGLPLPEAIQEVLQVNALEAEDTQIDYPSISELNEVMQVPAEALRKKLASDHPPVIIDVREPNEFSGELGHIEGSQSIPLKELSNRKQEIIEHKTTHVVIVCRAGVRSTTAAAILTALGFTRVSNLQGGMIEWSKQSFPVIRTRKNDLN